MKKDLTYKFKIGTMNLQELMKVGGSVPRDPRFI